MLFILFRNNVFSLHKRINEETAPVPVAFRIIIIESSVSYNFLRSTNAKYTSLLLAVFFSNFIELCMCNLVV